MIKALRSAAIAVTLIAAALGSAQAAKLRVGKAVRQNFGYVPLDVGMAAGIFARHGIEVELFDFSGGAKMHQALVAGNLDIALGAGTDMALIVKGSPAIAVAEISSSPGFMVFQVGADSPAKTSDDLKGKKIGVTSSGSLTQWLVFQLNRAKGWGDAGAVPVPLGGDSTTQVAALRTHEVDAYVSSPALGYELEVKGTGRVLFSSDQFLRRLELFTAFATNDLVARDPDAIRQFLAGWFESVSYMKTHRAESIAASRKITGNSEEADGRQYDVLMPQLSTDGKFDREALATLSRSFVDLKILSEPPDMTKLYTEQFLP
jgi:NitT/TauT family transport system substrate-binding protein